MKSNKMIHLRKRELTYIGNSKHSFPNLCQYIIMLNSTSTNTEQVLIYQFDSEDGPGLACILFVEPSASSVSGISVYVSVVHLEDLIQRLRMLVKHIWGYRDGND